MDPCSRCGFSGKVNTWKIAKLFGKVQIIIPCPHCGGIGKQVPPVIRTILWVRAIVGILLYKVRRKYQVWRFERSFDI